MPSSQIDKKLEAFVFSAHVGSTALSDYNSLFRFIEGIPDELRQIEIRNKVIAIAKIETRGSLFSFVAYEGERGLKPLLFNTKNIAERVEQLRPNEVLATRTHVLLNIKTKKAVIEYNHKGAKANDIAYLISTLAQNNNFSKDLIADFTHIIGDDFLSSIGLLSRIRVAHVRFARPNPGWTDAKEKLTQIADESQAHVVDVEFTASRGESLTFNGGIIGFIRQSVERGLAIFKKVEIRGTAENVTREKVIKLDNYVESRNIAVTKDEGGHPSERSIKHEIEKYLKYVEEKNHSND